MRPRDFCPRISTILLVAAIVLAVFLSCEESAVTPRQEDTPSCGGLLTDDELMTDVDRGAVPVDSPWSAWIQNNNNPIRSLTEDCYTDLQFLKPLLGKRRLVQLGESSHGVAEFDAVKVRLIKFLHEEMGFDVIAFESSIFECYLANQTPDSISATEMMRRSIFGVWHAQEVLPLFEYIKETQSTKRPLILAGFDIQVSSRTGVLARPAFMRDVVAQIDPAYARTVSAIDSTFVVKYTQTTFEEFKSWVQANARTYMGYYQTMVSFFDAHADSLRSLYADETALPKIARQTAWSMPKFIQVVMAYPGMACNAEINQIISVRDRAMADNAGVLLDNVYPGKKMINWAHNFHIQHDSKTMGQLLAERYRPDLYTVGLYMYRGIAAHNDRQTYRVTPPVANSVESVFYCTRRKLCFVDMLHQQREAGNAWMFEQFLAKSWGLDEVAIVPREEYDAILFIDTVNPPDYVWFASAESEGSRIPLIDVGDALDGFPEAVGAAVAADRFQ